MGGLAKGVMGEAQRPLVKRPLRYRYNSETQKNVAARELARWMEAAAKETAKEAVAKKVDQVGR